MRISAVLFDANGVLYERSIMGMALQALLDHYGLKPRHPKIVHDYLRAATFDACLGRITADAYYDALLRVHGMTDSGLTAGREALRFDASRLDVSPTTLPVLQHLQANGLRLGVIVNSLYHAEEEIAWLDRAGVSADTWTVYLTSCDHGTLAPDPSLMGLALRGLDCPPEEILLLSRDESILSYGVDNGMLPFAYQSGYVAGVRGTIEQLGQLAAIVSV